jgi:hypothetical protein
MDIDHEINVPTLGIVLAIIPAILFFLVMVVEYTKYVKANQPEALCKKNGYELQNIGGESALVVCIRADGTYIKPLIMEK